MSETSSCLSWEFTSYREEAQLHRSWGYCTDVFPDGEAHCCLKDSRLEAKRGPEA